MKNKTVNLFGTEYTIEYPNEVAYTGATGDVVGVYGKCDSSNKKLLIAKKLNGIKQSPQDMQLTLYHEFIHAALIEGQYLESSTDEPMIEWLARCFVQAKKDKIL